MNNQAPRVLITGTGSGCGKTTVVCALLQALKNRGGDIAAFKCGPDYIDPMFHSEIIGAKSGNIDLFFVGEERARAIFLEHAAELNVIEGAMGYYDGIDAQSDEASAYHMARALDCPALLVVNGRGMGLSAAAVVKGFLAMRRPSGLCGVIFNQVSAAAFLRLKQAVERECDVRVYGFLPAMPDCALESRHLGLVTAREVEGLREKLYNLARQAEETLDIDGVIALGKAQAPLNASVKPVQKIGEGVRIAIARDEAFCFYYRENLELLERLGAELVEFSPLKDARLPICDGLILGGGYPELHADRLCKNRYMLASIREQARSGLPIIAECGGFMLLTEAIGESKMAGALIAKCRDMGKLIRFGYATFTARYSNLLLEEGESIRGHEFHYWDADAPGEAFQAVKPSGRMWACAYATDTLYAGFPHLYLPSNPRAAERFVRTCHERRARNETHGD